MAQQWETPPFHALPQRGSLSGTLTHPPSFMIFISLGGPTNHYCPRPDIGWLSNMQVMMFQIRAGPCYMYMYRWFMSWPECLPLALPDNQDWEIVIKSNLHFKILLVNCLTHWMRCTDVSSIKLNPFFRRISYNSCNWKCFLNSFYEYTCVLITLSQNMQQPPSLFR